MLNGEEFRLYAYARATQIAQREYDPRRRLFQPRRTTLQQPQVPRRSVAFVDPTVGRPGHIGSPASTWESDFSDRSEWEQDWDDDADVADSTGPAPSLTHSASTELPESPELVPPRRRGMMPSASSRPATGRPATATGLDIDGLVEHLRVNHECSHER